MDESADIAVLLADDHPIVRSGLSALLASIPGVRVVGEAGNGRAAVREVALTHPDVVVMDLRMPEMDGVQATREILATFPSVAVLVLTMFDEDEMISQAIRAGARGYLLKGAEQEEIERAIRAVAAGEVIFSADVAAKVLRRLTVDDRPDPSTVPLPSLTQREREVLSEIAGGAGNATVALRLSLSPKTVGNHISSIFAKLGVSTRAEAIVMARRAGLGDA